MKTIIQSLAISFLIHIIFVVGPFIIGYIKTKNYTPQLDSQWGDAVILQSEVGIAAFSPIVLLSSFIGVALVGGIIITICKKAFAS